MVLSSQILQFQLWKRKFTYPLLWRQEHIVDRIAGVGKASSKSWDVKLIFKTSIKHERGEMDFEERKLLVVHQRAFARLAVVWTTLRCVSKEPLQSDHKNLQNIFHVHVRPEQKVQQRRSAFARCDLNYPGSQSSQFLPRVLSVQCPLSTPSSGMGSTSHFSGLKWQNSRGDT